MTTRQSLIWVVDSDANQRTLLQNDLHQAKFDTRSFAHSRDIERRLARERPDLLLLERALDGEDGLELCRRIRASGDDVPIFIVTHLNEPCERISGFEFGADDYIGKPYVSGELIARIQAQLRRRRLIPIGAPLPHADAISFGECRLEMDTRTLIRAGETIELTSGEFAVLSAFVNNAHRSMTRERLIELSHRPDNGTSQRAIDVQISRLRRLIENDPSKPRHIQTVWGYGYVFVPSAQ